ncbi:response regulator transcription factor [Ruminococcus flavefaciens]|uniref:response regulator transcription factor n=1 Tax=Ruminococcus flavefaciens TaxID=1265 RepID=UPI0026EB3AD1|nr:response regulator transcription factor [Ruminococcus flavefaciens]MBQ4219656.1 response regulator transcription factor [Butyrivibrio sp.]
MYKILILEDDVMIASGLAYAIESEGYEAVIAKNIKDAAELIKISEFDLGILDMQLPDGRGIDIGKKLKEDNIPVIFLTVEDDESNIVKAFESGADDYVVKPFKIRELLARIKRIFGWNKDSKEEFVKIGSVKIDTAMGKVYVNDELVELTALEYRLLLIFAGNRGILLTRNQILEKIWDSAGNFVEDNTLTVYVKRLREKLGKNINIETVRGIGYRVD